MAVRVLTDFHHSSLLRSLIMLFEDRLGMEVYRPIGMQWFAEGYWAINNQYDTAKQYLSMDQVPSDGTPVLNREHKKPKPLNTPKNKEKGIFYCYDPGGTDVNRACTLDFFKNKRFDYLIASIPAHIPLYKRLISEYHPSAKLIVQMGNEWPFEFWEGNNILASVKPRQIESANAIFYHQEFSTKIFKPTPCRPTKKVYSFVNVLQNMPQAQGDFDELERLLKPYGYEFGSYGGQNRDGNMNGPRELADKMHDAEFILHSKPGGDGFGHIIFNAYAVGRPVITRSSQYRERLAEELLVPGTYIDLDKLGHTLTAQAIQAHGLDKLEQMGKRASERFQEVVNYEKEAEEIAGWLTRLK